MNWFSFLVGLANALAWPATAIVLVYLLRQPLNNLLPRINSLKFKEFQIDFETKLAKVADELSALPPPDVEGAEMPPVSKFLSIAWTGGLKPNLTPYH